MKIDIVSVFPEYFSALNVGLFGKAQERGLVEIATHDLRDWTHDVHHSVDDTPVGGGAGMVMKPEIWAECLDELLGLEPTEISTFDSSNRAGNHTDAHRTADCAGTASVTGAVDTTSGSAAEASLNWYIDAVHHDTRDGATTDGLDATDAFGPSEHVSDDAEASATANTTGQARPTAPTPHSPVLIFPNPSAPLFTQRDATELAHANHLLFGCGRYEGYDARIPRYYRSQGVDVREYSIGDYVLNGGEVAVSVMLEAITRLMPGFMGNPDSIVEESYTGSNALLEHYQYTRPTTWRGMAVPEILTSGDHGKVDRFRRDEALTHTAAIRPDLIEALDCKALDKPDRKTLMALGWEVSGTHPRKI